MIVVDSGKVNYQTMLTTTRIAKHVWREEISNQNKILLGLKIIDWIADAKNAREDLPGQ